MVPAQVTARDIQPLSKWLARNVSDCSSAPIGADESSFEPVALPDYRDTGQVHYRHQVVSPELDKGCVAFLKFTAVDYEADVFWDGERIGSHRGYFAPFSFEITSLLGAPGTTHQLDVVVRGARDWVVWDGALGAENHGDAHGKGLGSVVDGQLAAGTGLLGDVTIEYADALRIGSVNVVGDAEALTAHVTTSVVNSAERSARLTVRCRVNPRNGSGVEVEASVCIEVAGGATVQVDFDVRVPDGSIWNPESPWLYWADVELCNDGTVVDSSRMTLAFRAFTRGDDGSFHLNGHPIFLRGTTTIGCLWEAAWSGDEEAVIRQLLLVKALFANTLRIHVHVLPELVYDCADRLGILIYQDAPLQWHCFDRIADRVEEELQQVDELALRVRHHPSVVILSLSNEMHMDETLHDADSTYLARAVERTVKVAPGMVLVQDFTGPDRPHSLAWSIHEYPGYFVGTARSEIGALEARTSGSRVVVSEYGVGALESWQAMRKLASDHGDTQDSTTLVPTAPESTWTTEGMGDHVLAESLRNTQKLVGRHFTWREYHEASNRYQAFALRHQTATLRRDRERVSGVIQHFLQNPATVPYNPWVDLAIIDRAGIPTLGFDALREAFRPLALDIVTCGPRAYEDSTVQFTPWIFSDLPELTSCLLSWRWESSEPEHDSMIGETRVDVPSHSSVRFETIQLPVPYWIRVGQTATLTAQIYVGDRAWCSNTNVVNVCESLDSPELNVEVLGDVLGASQRLSRFGVAVSEFDGHEDNGGVILVTPRVDLTEPDLEDLLNAASAGARVVLLERPSGETMPWLDPRYPPQVAGGSPSEFVQPEFSLAESGIVTGDLSDWTTRDGRVVEHPLIAVDTRTSPRWASCGPHLSLSAVHEFVVHHGSIIVCQSLVWQTLESEPIAWLLMRHMLTKMTRKI